jgi:hypothetical protein
VDESGNEKIKRNTKHSVNSPKQNDEQELKIVLKIFVVKKWRIGHDYLQV